MLAVVDNFSRPVSAIEVDTALQLTSDARDPPSRPLLKASRSTGNID